MNIQLQGTNIGYPQPFSLLNRNEQDNKRQTIHATALKDKMLWALNQ